MLTKLTILATLILLSNQTVVINQITGVTSNLMYTGTIEARNEKLFFTYYGIDEETDPSNLSKSPLTIVVGAPGRSSSYFNYGGLGPKLLKNDLTLIDNPNRLTNWTNVLFLDLLGSGFSFASDFNNIPTSSHDHGVFLTEAINSFISQVDFGKSSSIYIISESTFVRSVDGLDDIDPLKAIFHVSPWPDFYQVGRFYATAGIQTEIFGQAQRITIQSTFQNCYMLRNSQKFLQAHQCYDSTLNYIEANTKNRNLLNLPLGSNLTDFVPMIQYYLSQSSVVSTLKAPTQRLFDAHAPKVQSQLYVDMAKNYDTNITRFLKDYLSVKNIFIVGDNDFVNYRKGVRDWLQNKLNFVGVDTFRTQTMKEFIVDGQAAGLMKGIDQIKYYEVYKIGHYGYNDNASVMSAIVKSIMLGEEIESREIFMQE